MNRDGYHSYERTAYMRWADIDVAVLTFVNTPAVALVPRRKAELTPRSRNGFPRCRANDGTVGGRHGGCGEHKKQGGNYANDRSCDVAVIPMSLYMNQCV